MATARPGAGATGAAGAAGAAGVAGAVCPFPVATLVLVVVVTLVLDWGGN